MLYFVIILVAANQRIYKRDVGKRRPVNSQLKYNSESNSQSNGNLQCKKKV